MTDRKSSDFPGIIQKNNVSAKTLTGKSLNKRASASLLFCLYVVRLFEIGLLTERRENRFCVTVSVVLGTKLENCEGDVHGWERYVWRVLDESWLAAVGS